jgi:hypothetical protein
MRIAKAAVRRAAWTTSVLSAAELATVASSRIAQEGDGDGDGDGVKSGDELPRGEETSWEAVGLAIA